VDLSRIRHELRTPINHILGYTEMLLEEGQLPACFMEDLQRIHAGGRRLQTLIGEYFDEEKFFAHRDLHQLCHELRTPVNHIIGYCELLQEQAQEQNLQSPVADLRKIHTAAGDWLALMEAYLIESPVDASEVAEAGSGATPPLTLTPGLGIQVPSPETARADFSDEGALLIVFRVGVMHRLGIVAEGLLGEALGVTTLERAFSPGITVGVQSHAADFQPRTTLLELRRTVAWAHDTQIGKKGAGLRAAL
jgi:hypothetical protein